MSRTLSVICSLSVVFLLNACTGVENNTSKILDNANDAIKPENNSVWWGGENGKTNKDCPDGSTADCNNKY